MGLGNLTKLTAAGLAIFLGLALGPAAAQSGFAVESAGLEGNPPPHSVTCAPGAGGTDIECLIWSATGEEVIRGRALGEGVELTSIGQIDGAATNAAVAIVVGGVGAEDVVQQRARGGLAIALRGIGQEALLATLIAGDETIEFQPNSPAVRTALLDAVQVDDPGALARSAFAAVEALETIDDRPRALVLAGAGGDVFTEAEIDRLRAALERAGITLTVVLLPSQGASDMVAMTDLPVATLFDTSASDGALVPAQIGAIPTAIARVVRVGLGVPDGAIDDGVGFAAEFEGGGRTQVTISEGAQSVARIGFPQGGALALLPRNIDFLDEIGTHIPWLVVLIAGMLVALYGLVKPRPRKEPIDTAALRAMPMRIPDTDVAPAAARGAPAPTTPATRAVPREPETGPRTEPETGPATGAQTAVLTGPKAARAAPSAAPPPSPARLVFPGDRVEPLRPGTTRIGRLGPPDNDVVISEPHVSRRHAEIVLAEGGRTVIRNLTLDTQSQSRRENPVFVNGERIGADAPLKHGDDVRLGDATETGFRFELEQGA